MRNLKLNITVRLYKLHDYDLIYLYKNLHFPLREAMKKALIGWVRKEPVFFDFPVADVKDELGKIKNAQFHIKLDETEEADIIAYLSGLKKFYRNSFLKNLVRGSLTGPVGYVYEDHSDIREAKERNEEIRSRILGIETLKPEKARKRRKYIILEEGQMDLFEKTGALNDVDIKMVKRGEDSEG